MIGSRVLHIVLEDIPFPGTSRWRGLALTKHGRVEFYCTLSPLVVLLSVQPTKAGLRLIKEMEDVLGPASLRYCDARGNYKDFTAEWYPTQDRELIALRLAELIAGRLDYKTTEIPEEKTDKQ